MLLTPASKVALQDLSQQDTDMSGLNKPAVEEAWELST
jgi:hypothetical protein